MKKKIIICSLVALIFVCATLFSWLAVSGGDSVDFILPLSLDVDEVAGERVIKVYIGVYTEGFATRKSIKSLIDDRYKTFGEVYISVDKSGEVTPKIIHNNVDNPLGREDDYCESGKALVEIVDNAELLFGNIDNNINIEKIYCLDGFVRDGLYVYFITNKGDFVYYKDFNYDYSSEKAYLFPIDVFYGIAEEKFQYVLEIREQELDGAYAEIKEIEGIEKYEIVDFKPVFLETYKK